MPLELWLVSLAGLALAWRKDRPDFFLFRGGFKEMLVEGLALFAALAVALIAYHYGRAWLPPVNYFQGEGARYPHWRIREGTWHLLPFALLARAIIFESLLLGLLDRMRLAAVPKLMRGVPLRLLLAALLSLVLWAV